MALVEDTLFWHGDKVETAIQRLKASEPKSEPYWLAFSGGKDSQCIYHLAFHAGCLRAHHRLLRRRVVTA